MRKKQNFSYKLGFLVNFFDGICDSSHWNCRPRNSFLIFADIRTRWNYRLSRRVATGIVTIYRMIRCCELVSRSIAISSGKPRVAYQSSLIVLCSCKWIVAAQDKRGDHLPFWQTSWKDNLCRIFLRLNHRTDVYFRIYANKSLIYLHSRCYRFFMSYYCTAHGVLTQINVNWLIRHDRTALMFL